MSKEGIGFYFKRAKRYYKEKECERCIETLTLIINATTEATDDYKAAAYNNRGLVKGALGKYEEAIADYTYAIELRPDFAEAYYNRGNAKGDLGKYEEAIADYTYAIELRPDYAEAYYNRGNYKGKLGKQAEAIADYTYAIELRPDYAEAYNNRGNYKGKLGKQAEAIADYTYAIELRPDYAEAYYNRGNYKGKLGKQAEAIADCDKAIELRPDYAEAYYNRGNYKGKLGKQAEAIADYDKAIELKSDYAEAYYNRGNAKGDLGKYEEAKEDYHKAIEKQCENAQKDYRTRTCYKFIPISKHGIDMLVKQRVYFSDVPSLNDPLECPLLKVGTKVYEEAFKDEHEPRIFSLVVPPYGDEQDENGIHKVVNNTLLFSHYADAHKGICIEYTIDGHFLKQGRMFYTDVQYSEDTKPDSLQKLFAIKDTRWKYEHEGRFVAFGKGTFYSVEKDQTKHHTGITKIIFGLKTPEEDKTLLWKLLRGKEPNKEPEIRFFNTLQEDGQYFQFTFTEYTSEDADELQTT